MTNAEKIRQMSDEELAYIITCPLEIDKNLCAPEANCIECSLEWLKEEAKT